MISKRLLDITQTLSMSNYGGICPDCGEYSECLNQACGRCPNCHRLDDPDVYRDQFY